MRSDFTVLLANRLLRAFAFGAGAVVLGVQLERRGLSPGEIGLTLTIGIFSAAVTGLISASVSGRLGRRRVLAATGVLMCITGLDLALSTSPQLLVLAGVTGMLGGASVDWGPFISVEQAVLVETVPASKRNRAFARYALTGGLASAGGSLVAGLATNLARGSALFVCFAGLGLVTAALPLLLSKSVEGKPEIALATNRRPLLRLSGLFTLDAFSGGLVGNAVVAYWLHVRFHVGTELLGPAFTAMALLVAPSYLIAGWLGDRIGLIKTMVFTHLPAGLLLLLVPFAPNIEWAIAILLVRNSISQMDIPVRQAYVVSVVGPGERAGAVAITGAVRGFGQAFGPVIAGLAIQSMAFAFPFFLAASAQVIYDVGLYAGFRNRRGEHEVDWRSAREQNDASPPLP